jgi:16S rRNA (guanine966-N2)-methyltransferase
MRVTGGSLRGRTIQAPRGSRTRPTTDRVREALFNLIGARISLAGADVLDLFAGSGALSFEALSRGSGRALLVERHGPTLALARRTAADLGIADACMFVRADALKWITAAEARYDLIFADPPYALPELPRLPDLLLPRVRAGGLLALESSAETGFDSHPLLAVTRVYGSTRLTLFAP